MADTVRLYSDVVRELDPSEEERPAYEFSNGRKFIQPTDVYQATPE